MRPRLQDAKIRAIKPPATGRIELRDTNPPELMLRVTARGVKTFCIAYKVKGEHPHGPSKTGKARVGKQHRITLGTYPMLSLVKAREKARLLLEQVDQGIDPRPERARAAHDAHENTVRAVARRFLQQDCKGLASAKRIQRTLELYVLPTLGQKSMIAVERADIHHLLDALVDPARDPRPMPGAAREVLKHLHRLFDYAYDRGIITSNPAHKLKRKDLKTNGDSGRALTDSELRAIWHAAESIGYPFGDWIRLLMLTGQRRSEWMCAHRDEIDSERRVLDIPASRYKTGRDHAVPLVGPAWELVQGLPIWNAGGFLFSTTGGAKAINSAGDAKKRLDSLTPGIAPWKFHDLRHTCKTRLAALGVSPEHRDRVQGHAQTGMDQVYNKHDYLAEKRAALDLYGAHILKVVA
jgi:integrase